jgi:hypothetical protein
MGVVRCWLVGPVLPGNAGAAPVVAGAVEMLAAATEVDVLESRATPTAPCTSDESLE